MAQNAFLNSVFTCSVIILLCPRNIRLDSPPAGQIQVSHHKAAKAPINPNLKSTNVKPYSYLLRSMNKYFFDNDEEPGFDLTESEMKRFKIWPKGVIPYFIDVVSFSDKVLRDKIRNFLNNINSATSLNFIELPSPPKDDKTRWVFFVNRRGQLKCADPSIKDFTNEGVQQVVLGYDCVTNGGDLAEVVLALLGIPAQHNAPDRDMFIKINEENIEPDKKKHFEKLKDNEWLFHDISYDYMSAGHYDFYRHSANGRATIELLNESPDIIVGEPTSPSHKDIWKIKMLYNYISKKKTDIPECQKLFAPGVNFNKFKPKTESVKPREKHSNYTGIPEDENQDDENKNNNSKSDDTEDKKNDVESKREADFTDITDDIDKNGSESDPDKVKLSNKKYILDVLSDYISDDEYRKLKDVNKLKFKPVKS